MQTDPNEVSFIRSMDDWKYRIRNADSKDHPLQPLTREDLDEFTNSLVFNNGGLAGASVGILEEKLTYRQYERVIGWFGMDLRLMADYKGYKCAGQGTCTLSQHDICTSNC